MAHLAPGGERHLAVLQVEAGVREQPEVADMVVVQVRDDDVPHARRLDAEDRQGLDRRSEEAAAAPHAHLGAEAGVDDADSINADRHPDEVVHVDAAVVRIGADEEIAALPGVELGVLDRVQLIHGLLRARITLIVAGIQPGPQGVAHAPVPIAAALLIESADRRGGVLEGSDQRRVVKAGILGVGDQAAEGFSEIVGRHGLPCISGAASAWWWTIRHAPASRW